MKKNLVFFFLVFTIVTLLLSQGCTAHRPISNKKYPPIDTAQIELYFAKIPNRDFEELAFVFSDDFKGLKIEAGKLGANAVVLIRYNKGYDGIAIRWK